MRKKFIPFFAAFLIFTSSLSSCTSHSLSAISQISAPFSKPLIIIDPGHGGADGGGVSVNGIPEKGINLNISLTLSDMLTLFGYQTALTRTTDVSIHDSGTEGLKNQKLSDMENRLAIFNSDNAVCISIHQNRYTDSSSNGAQMFYYRENSQSAQLAENLRLRFCTFLQPENLRETKPCDDELYLLKNCENPAVMAECGFISNPDEAALLEHEPYQNQVAFSLMCGLNDYHLSSGRISENNLENER